MRVWMIGYGQPHVHFMDEGFHVYYGLNFGGGDLNPHDFAHPSLYFYLCFFVNALFILGGKLFGFFRELGDAWSLYKTDSTIFYILARGVSAVLGTLTIPLVYFLGSKVFDKRTGFLAAFFLTFAYLHVQYSQVAYIDVPLTFFITGAVLNGVVAGHSGKLRDILFTGFLGGLAASTKYNGFITLMLGPLACFVSNHSRGKHLLSILVGKEIWLYFLIFVFAFTLGTPFWILDFPEFKKDLGVFFDFYKIGGVGHLGYEGRWNWIYYLVNPLQYGLGFPLEIVGWAGMFFFFARRNWQDLLWTLLPISYFIFMGRMDIRTPRYILPVVPFLCLGAAALLCLVVSKSFSTRAKLGRSILLGLGMLLALPNIGRVLRYNYLKTFPDTRVQAHQWIQENLDSGNPILESLYGFTPKRAQFPAAKRLDATLFDTRVHHVSTLKSVEEYRKMGFKYLLMDEWHIGMALISEQLNPNRKSSAERYPAFLKELDQSVKLLKVFSPYKKEGVPFDTENVEFASRYLWQMKSLGPTIRIYEL